MTKLCRDCVRVLSQLFTNAETEYGHFGPSYTHLSSAVELPSSALTCRLCRLILQTVHIFDGGIPSALLSAQVVLQERYRDVPIQWSLCRDAQFPSISPNIGCQWTRLHISIQPGYSLPALTSGLILFSRPGTAALTSSDVVGREPLNHSGSVDAVELLRTWLSCCIATHTKCLKTAVGHRLNPAQEPILPTRVLDVGCSGSSQALKLHESQGRRAQYVTLSHCWGQLGKVKLRTTKNNLEKHIQHIEREDLSQTFRDAVDVVRGIGLRYLWIDSLCIVQDDAEDWGAESQQMGRYYENSTLTIAASAKDTEADGLFAQRRPHVPVFEAPYIDRAGVETGSFFIAPFFYPKEKLDTTALSKRAWAAQERVLSRRIIHYQENTMVWSCRELSIADCGLDTIMECDLGITDWPRFVQEYSCKDLTLQKDRLVAIQGLANLLKTVRQDGYFFGFWTGDLPMQLWWRKAGTMTKNIALPHVPTWSWASKVGPINPFKPVETPFYDWIKACDLVEIEESGRLTLIGHIKQFDELRYESMSLFAQSENIRWGLGIDNWALMSLTVHHSPEFTVMVNVHDLAVGGILLDCQDIVDGPLSFFLLAKSEQRHSSGDLRTMCQVLVLQRSASRPDAFERMGVGLFDVEMYNEFLGEERRDVVLI